MDHSSIFHEGQRAVQERTGQTSIAIRNAAILSDTVIGGARLFIGQQFMVALGSVDERGAVWSSLLFGPPGFMHTEDGVHIAIDVPPSQRDGWDPLWDNIDGNSDIGMLFIDLGTRRRYRVNGRVARIDGQGITVAVKEAFPNCPKYVQRRQLISLGETAIDDDVTRGTELNGELGALMAGADTVFLASHHPRTGADVSHRGGNRGFVHMADAHTIRLPDYQGNSMFNTLGNFQIDPRAGLCIPDFASRRLLQFSGSATVLWDQPDPHNETGGTGRVLEVAVDSWILRSVPQQLEWQYLDPSPYLPQTE